MVSVYLSDREQEEALRDFWRDNWRWILSGIVLGLALIGGWRFWQQQRVAQAEKAAALYRELEQAIDRNEATHVDQLGQQIEQNYASTPYADHADLALA